jgi:hypothetical protein
MNAVTAPRLACLGLALLAMSAIAISLTFNADTATAAQRYCKPRTKDGVRVIRLQRVFGCKTGVRLVAAVVNGGGYYEDIRYYCRYGQGGTRPIRVRGHTYYGGLCYREDDKREASFLARRTRK